MAHFSFIIEENGQRRECMLQGSGGLLGNGGLYRFDVDMEACKRQNLKEQACADCLRLARLELERTGSVREFRGEDLPPSQRIRLIQPTAILKAVLHL